jgi:mono/diheme cytochrome c family protein
VTNTGMFGRLPSPLLVAVAGCLLLTAPALCQTQTGLQQRGEVIARGMCSGCHGVEKTGDSPHPAAPRFRSLDNQTDLSKLAQRIREGLWSGHEDMPMYRFNREDADAVVAYMRSIQGP